MRDPTQLTATELLEGYRSRALSPVEAVTALLERIEATDHAYNAFCHRDVETTLEQARSSERRWQSGAPLGLLDGVPVAVKDVFLTRGWPTLKGSKTIDAAGPWEVDAPVVASLRAHGAVLLGKTTTPEIGWKAVTDSPLHGVTRNPWDPRRTAGGSSGGSSAALAARMAPLALGTDGGGSIRVPCAFCGLAGIKPTYGRVPLWPPSPFGTLAHAGPMARTVTDTALLLTVLAGPDARDWTALPPEGRDYRDGLDEGIEGLRVAYSPTLGYVDVDAEVRAATDRAARVLADLGARVDEVDPGFDDPLETFTVLWNAGAANALRHLDGEGRALLDPGLAEVVAEGERSAVMDYLAATARRGELGVHMGRFHETYDLLVTPAVSLAAFEAGREVPAGWPHRRWPTWASLSIPFNMSQQPAATVPCGFTSAGLPVGLQVVGAKYADALVLRAARAYERADTLHDRQPPEEISEDA